MMTALLLASTFMQSLCLVLALAVAAFALPHGFVQGGIGAGGFPGQGYPNAFVEGGVGAGHGYPGNEGYIQGNAGVGTGLPGHGLGVQGEAGAYAHAGHQHGYQEHGY
ncbi:unnamed protein product [Euphydryas editha]|uniref:Uncharacterized protein n=1 Tax=Euphydryas editha TaxID=104508 RepID=A0AAU9TV40_EUPED|nr:unnamed protein product [Euphydryas editha]